jgi:hypothetical protein
MGKPHYYTIVKMAVSEKLASLQYFSNDYDRKSCIVVGIIL